MRRWLKCNMVFVCAVALNMEAAQGWAQQESTSKQISAGEQAVSVILKNYTLNQLALDPKTKKPLPRNGSWSVGKVPPASCPQTKEACVEVFYKVPAASVQCSWVVLLNGDGTEGKVLDENDDTERYWMRAVSKREASALVIARKKPIFPPIAIMARVSGDVIIEAIVGPSGNVQKVFALSGPAMVQQAAVNAAQNWSFKPMMVGARVVPYEIKLVFTFLTPGPPLAPIGTVKMEP
jgi:TonB family protein